MAKSRGSEGSQPPLLAAGVFLFLAMASVAILQLSHERLRAGMEHSVTAADNLMRARLALLQAHLSWERTAIQDPTFDPLRSLAEFDNAIMHLADLLGGESPLMALSARGFEDDDDVADRIATLRSGVSELRDRLLQGEGPSTSPVSIRLAFSTLEDQAGELERRVRERVRTTLERATGTHRVFMAGWIGFLIIVGVGAWGLRRARIGADRRRRLAEERLQDLRALMDAGVLLVGPEGRVEEMSRWWTRTLEWNEHQMTGAPWWTGLHPAERHRLQDLWRDQAHRRAPFSFEARAGDSDDGRERWVTALWRPVEGRDDDNWVGTFIDITRHHAVETQFQQSQKLEAIGRMSSGLAHDFNNLLTVTASNVELLQDAGSPRPGERDQILEDIAAATRAGRELVANLMRFSRRAELNIRPLALSEAVGEVMKLAARLLPATVEVEIQAPRPGPLVYADPHALQQIFMNLVANARDAMPDGGRLVVSVDRIVADDSFIEERPWIHGGTFGRVTVTDTGTGMDPETLEHVFEPFFSTKPEGEGTGLGLASVHGLVRQHGGHVHVYTEPGVGTSFRIYLPLVSEPASPGDGKPHAPEASSSGSIRTETDAPARPDAATRPNAPARPTAPMRVLLVEDDDVLLRTTRRALEGFGHEVVVTRDGRSALDAVHDAAAGFDLIVSDLLMPGLDGLQLARHLRTEGDDVPFVLTSGRHVSHFDREGAALPADLTFLPKPWTIEDLRRAVAEATSTRA